MSHPQIAHLALDPHGSLVLTDPAGQQHASVTPVRAFPLSAPEAGLSLVGSDGHELAWIDHLDQLPADQAQLLRQQLAQREFLPVLTRLVSVSTFSTPSRWSVETDRGPTTFILKGEEDIRRLQGPTLLIAASHGIQFLVPDRWALDKASRKLLERFL